MSFRRIFPALKLESDRMIYLDLLRVASSFAIIIYHFQNQMDLGPAADMVRARLEGFTLSVDLFFFISGFVITSVYAGRISTRADFVSFMGKRVARLVPLHWATFAVFAGFGILNAMGHLPSNHPEIYDPKCAVPNLLLLHAFGICSSLTFNYVSWSISAEMGMYALFPLLALIATRRYLSLVAVAVVIALLTAASQRTGWLWLEWSFDFGVLRALPTFLLGMISYHHRQLLGRVPRAAGWLLAACLLFLAGSLLQWPKLLLLLVIYTIGALGIAASEQPSSRAARRLAPLGQLTYSLYMLHPLVQTVLLTGIGATILKLRGLPMTLFVLAGLAAMVPIAWLSLVLFERPTRRWLTRLMGGKRAAPPEPAMFTPDSRW
jgi:peptidoglycan/LPS O-acetylase OafA/YrhL